jgi:hypothetical protein
VTSMSHDPLRFCVYCEADCGVETPQHNVGCPTTTGVFPIREKDLDPCENCGHYRHGMRCMDCDADLDVDDHYMLRGIAPGDPLLPGIQGAPIFAVICVGCAASAAVSQ